jgi:hypothetical protein
VEEYFIVVFRSRTQVLNFKRLLLNSGIPCEVYSTPVAISVGCGLSIKFEKNNLNNVKELVSFHRPQSFVGIYNIINNGYNEQIMWVL